MLFYYSSFVFEINNILLFYKVGHPIFSPFMNAFMEKVELSLYG